ncbi:MAG TPA: hypothetical protein VE222_00065, partial [Nitrospiraceae bacterium]|nr:hypothetical protein [Nitrospiraceae bacterium]
MGGRKGSRKKQPAPANSNASSQELRSGPEAPTYACSRCGLVPAPSNQNPATLIAPDIKAISANERIAECPDDG